MTKVEVTERALDHAVDVAGIGGITLAAYHDVASQAVVAGIVTIALGKRAVDAARKRAANGE